MSPLPAESGPPENRGELVFEDTGSVEYRGRRSDLAFAIMMAGCALIFMFTLFWGPSVRDGIWISLSPPVLLFTVGALIFLLGFGLFVAWTALKKDRFRVYTGGVGFNVKRRLPGGGFDSFHPKNDIEKIDVVQDGPNTETARMVIVTRETGNDGAARRASRDFRPGITDEFGAMKALAATFPDKCTAQFLGFCDLVKGRNDERVSLRAAENAPFSWFGADLTFVFGFWMIMMTYLGVTDRQGQIISDASYYVIGVVSACILAAALLVARSARKGFIDSTTLLAQPGKEGFEVPASLHFRLFTTFPRVIPYEWVSRARLRHTPRYLEKYAELELSWGEKYKFPHSAWVELGGRPGSSFDKDGSLVNPAPVRPAKVPAFRTGVFAFLTLALLLGGLGLIWLMIYFLGNDLAGSIVVWAALLIPFVPVGIAGYMQLRVTVQQKLEGTFEKLKELEHIYKVDEQGITIIRPGPEWDLYGFSDFRRVWIITDELGDRTGLITRDGKEFELPLKLYPALSKLPLPPRITRRENAMNAGFISVLGTCLVALFLFYSSIMVGWPYELKPGQPNEHEDWTVYMDLSGKKTISGRELSIYGDILVRDGAELVFRDCNITMNGTFFVGGTLRLENSRLRDWEPAQGYSFRGSLGTISFEADLSGAKSAAVTFRTDIEEEFSSKYHVNASQGGRTRTLAEVELEKEASTCRTLDLGAFCGGKVVLEWTAEDVEHRDFQLFGLELRKDGQPAPEGSLQLRTMSWGWEPAFVERPFAIESDGGNVAVVSSTLVSRHGVRPMMMAERADISLERSTVMSPIREEWDRSPGSNTITVQDCDLDIIWSNLTNRIYVYTISSRFRMSGSVLNGEGRIDCLDTALLVINCRFENCSSPIEAKNEKSPFGRSAQITGSVFLGADTAITLLNTTGTVKGCTFSGRTALEIFPGAGVSREACQMDYIVLARQNNISSRVSRNADPAVKIYSSVPVIGIEGLVTGNSWNCTAVLERTIFVGVVWPGQFGGPHVLYNDNGSVVEYDGAMARKAENRYSGQWKYLGSYGVDKVERPDWRITLQTMNVERLEVFGAGFSLRRLDEGHLDFRAENSSGIGHVRLDTYSLTGPRDFLEVNITLRPVCDLSIRNLWASYDAAGSTLNVSFGLDTLGLKGDRFEAVCRAGDMMRNATLEWGSYSHSLTLDAAAPAGRTEVSLQVRPIGIEDEDLRNNEAGTNLSYFNESREFSKEVEVSGNWQLERGVNLTFRNCTLNSTEKSGIYGLDRNRLDFEDCAINATGLSLYAENGTIRRTEVLPGASNGLSLGGGTWLLDNVTVGSSAAGFERTRASLEGALRDFIDRYGFAERSYTDLAGSNLRLGVNSENLTITDSRILCTRGIEWNVPGRVTISNSTFAMVSYFYLWSGELDFSGSRVDVADQIMLLGENVSVKGCVFRDVIYGSFIASKKGNCSFTGNVVSGDFGYGSVNPRVTFSAGSAPVLSNNTFSGFRAAIRLDCPGDIRAVGLANTFGPSVVERVVQTKYITMQFQTSLALTGDLHIDVVVVNWTDLSGPEGSTEYAWNYEPGVSAYLCNVSETVETGILYSNGSAVELSEIPLAITVVYRSYYYMAIHRTVVVRDDYHWIEDIG